MPFTENTEYIIYRAKLAVYETDRLKIRLENLVKILVFIEDKGFYKHSGISYKSLVRGILGQFGVKRRSGGSTIIQQLIRTLFIRNLSLIKRRKFTELGLAPWLNATLGKNEILSIYLSSVRFERGKFGVVEAMKYFWGKVELKPSLAQSFFLIERVSNTRSKLLSNKISEMAMNAVTQDILSKNDLVELEKIYRTAVLSNLIIANEVELEQLKKGLNA